MNFVSSATADVSGVGNKLTIAKPAGVIAGHTMLAFLHVYKAAIWTVPQGWVSLGPAVALTTNHYLYAYVKIAGASEPASYDWKANSGTAPTDLAGAILAYSGGSVTNPVDQAASQTNPSNVNAPAPSVNAAVAGGQLVTAIVAPGQLTATPPAGETERVDFYTGWSNFAMMEVAGAAIAAAGATGVKTAVLSAAAVSGAWTVALRPGNPTAPTLQTPGNGDYLDAAAGLTVAWQHNSQVDAAQSAYALRRKTTGAYEWWNATLGAWQSTEVFNATATQSVEFAAALWANGNTYSWSVATQDSGGTSPYANDWTLHANTAPVVSVTAPASAATPTVRPAVTWQHTDAESDPQLTYRVKVFDAATYSAAGFDPDTSPAVWDSTELAGNAAQITVGTDLVNGSSYRAYVQTSQIGGVYSEWAFSDFTVALDPLATPSLVAVWDSTLARCTLEVQGHDNLLTANQSSAETDANGGFDLGNTNVSRSTDVALDGSASWKLTGRANGDLGIFWRGTGAVDPGALSAVPVSAGKTYLIVASARAATSARQVGCRVYCYDAGGNNIAVDDGPLTADSAAGWKQAGYVWTAPAGAAMATPAVHILSAAAGETHYLDCVGLAPMGDLDEFGYEPAWTIGGFAGIATAIVEASDDGGETWSAIRGSGLTVPAPDQLVTLEDLEAPPGVAREYRARMVATL